MFDLFLVEFLSEVGLCFSFCGVVFFWLPQDCLRTTLHSAGGVWFCARFRVGYLIFFTWSMLGYVGFLWMSMWRCIENPIYSLSCMSVALPSSPIISSQKAMKEDAVDPSFFNFSEAWQKRPFTYQRLLWIVAGCITILQAVRF
jgi:hypothetical protein